MHLYKKAIICVFCLLITVMSFGQTVKDYYTIQLGTFTNPQLEDFSNLKNYGHIYAEELKNHSFQVHLGGFSSRYLADKTLKKVKSKGHQEAFVKTAADGKEVFVVQVGSQSLNEKISWARYLNLGRIHTILDGNSIKMISGVYPDKRSAYDRLTKARQMGFTDAFIKGINSNVLHEVNAFETGGLMQSSTVEVLEMDIPTDYEMMGEPTYASAFAARGVNVSPTTNNAPVYTAPVYTAPVVYKSNAPFISSATKRQSIQWLQELLEQTGTFSAKVDGKYTYETGQAFAAAKDKNYQLARFVKIAASSVQPTYGDFRDWEDVVLLRSIANNLNNHSKVNDKDNELNQLFSNPEILDLNEQQLIVSWDYRFRRGLKNWGSTDALRSEMAAALKTAYLQTQIRLENYFTKKGFNAERSKGLALTTLKSLIGEQINIFQTM